MNLNPKFLRILFAGCAVLLVTACCQGPRPIDVRLEKQDLSIKSDRYGVYPLQPENERLAGVYPQVAGLREGWQAMFVTEELPRALYRAYLSGRTDEATCMGWFGAWGMDTASVAGPEARLFLAFALGQDSTGAQRMMFDTDGDYDFSDETDYPTTPGAVRLPMAYDRVVNGAVVPDVTWVETDDVYGQLGVVLREMTRGEFRIGDAAYTCTVLSGGTSYKKGDCEVLFSNGDLTARFDLGDYAWLGDACYRLDSLSPDGRLLRLAAVPEREDPESTQIGFRPYAFTATDMTGRTIRFPEDFAGKYVLLDFWATGCGPCCEEIRNLYPGIYARYKDAGFEIVGVADNTADDLRAFMQHTPMPWVVVADREDNRRGQNLYGIRSYPTLYLIGPDGRIVEKETELRGGGLERMLRHYMPGVPAPAEETAM